MTANHPLLTVRAAAALLITVMCGACSLPPVELRAQRPLPLRSEIRAADGSTLARLYKQNRELVSIRQLPKELLEAVLAAEDARFFEHEGYDVRAIGRAALANLESGDVTQGGSTITQQYVKNTYFRDPSRTLTRKARELRLAVEVEQRLSKLEILERYLNTVYFGEGAYGVEAAAETYFGRDARRLTLRQSAVLASLIKSPAGYDPRDHPRRAMERRNYVIDRMAELGDIRPGRAVRAKRTPLGVTQEPPRPATRQPYFVEAVVRELMADPRLGSTAARRERALWEGGLEVRTTLVPRLQRAAQVAAAQVLNEPGDPEAALIAIRPDSGEIVAMVGGRDWSSSQVNLALGVDGGGSGRQPGSSFKPIVAATALETGMSFDDSYPSGPARFTFDDGSTWTVRNAEGTSYGPMTLHDAMVHSVNGVYARLAIALGAGQIAGQAELMGVTTELPSYPSIALGSAEVSVLDMASAYATLANGGTATEPTTIKSVELPDGGTITPDVDVVSGALSPGTAYLVTEVLQDVVRDGTGRAAFIGRPAAGKTGTTNDYADAWFVGYTPELVAAVWVGYPQGRIPMTDVHGVRVLGGTFPAVIWRNFMLRALTGEPVRSFEVPKSELVSVTIDPVSGLLAADWCGPGVQRTMLRQEAPTEYCPVPPPSPSPKASPSPSPTEAEDSPSPEASPRSSPDASPSPSESPSPAPSASSSARASREDAGPSSEGPSSDHSNENEARNSGN